jgi:hypothetical protein
VTGYDRTAFLQLSAGALKFLRDEFFVWKDRLILHGEHLVGEIVECVVGFCCITIVSLSSY